MKPFTGVFSPGHTATSQGASRGVITEYGLSSAVIGDLIFKLSKIGHTAYLIGSASNSAQVKTINKIAPDFGLELHFNANVLSDVNGSMCLHSGSDNGYRLATRVNNKMVGLLHTRDAGIHKAHYQLDVRKPIITMVKKTSCPFIICEPLYLSNDKDFERIDIQLISTAIFEGILSYWEVA